MFAYTRLKKRSSLCISECYKKTHWHREEEEGLTGDERVILKKNLLWNGGHKPREGKGGQEDCY